jgi:VIT1/CCC1 family predicted Fe2+/Mn2+ transporter
MLHEEHGASSAIRSPMAAAAATFGAFVICGLVPMLPFLVAAGQQVQMQTATVMTAAVFFGIGALKSKWSMAPWWRSAVETLAIGLIAAGLAFAVGKMLKTLAGV